MQQSDPKQYYQSDGCVERLTGVLKERRLLIGSFSEHVGVTLETNKGWCRLQVVGQDPFHAEFLKEREGESVSFLGVWAYGILCIDPKRAESDTRPLTVCMHCGSPLVAQAKFCGQCGHPIPELSP